MQQKITLQNLHTICKGFMNWDREKVEEVFQGTRKELVNILNTCTELELELFFSGFFCNNPLVAWAADGQMELKMLSAEEKVQLFIHRGEILCYFTGSEPGLIVKPPWKDNTIPKNIEF